MTKNILGQLVLSATLLVSAVAPAMALDYEAKPVNWVIQAPFRTVGALSGAVVRGAGSGPMEHSYHGWLKGEDIDVSSHVLELKDRVF